MKDYKESKITASLTKEVIVGSLNYGVCSYIQMAISISAEIVLARLLLPEDFGKIGYIVSIITMAFMFSAFSGQSAIVQNVKWDDDQYGFNAWFLNLSILIFICIILLLFGILSKRINTYLFIAIMLSQALNQISTPYKAFMQIKMQFLKLGLIPISANIISIGGAIWLAYHSYGYWSLAYKVISLNLCTWLLFWLLSPIRLKFRFNREILIDIINFGKYALLSNIFERTYRQMDYITVGKTIGDEGLGYYKRAYFLSELFATIGFGAVAPVFAPIYSRLQNDKKKLSQLYITINLFFSYLCILFYLITGCLIADIIVLLFGSKWLPTVPIFLAIIPYAIICPIRRVNRHIHLNTGRSKGVAIAQFFEVMFFLICLFPFIHFWGLIGVALAVDIGALIGIILLFYSSAQFIDFKIIDIFMIPTLWGIISLIIFLQIRDIFIFNNILLKVVSQGLIIVFIYILGIFVVDKKRIINIFLLVRNRKSGD